jgi:hypothetical protein
MKRTVGYITVVVQALGVVLYAGCARDADENVAMGESAYGCKNCHADSGTPDSGMPDTSTPDAGDPDSGIPDAGEPDSGMPDSGSPDSGTPDGGVGACRELVNHSPTIDGMIFADVQMMQPESVFGNSTTFFPGSLFVPGTPLLQLNGSPNFGGTVDGSGSMLPTGYIVIINSGATLGNIVRWTDPVPLSPVAPPPPPTGTRSVVLSNPSDDPGNFATLRDLTLNSNVGPVVVPPGTYGNFIANSGSGFVLGVANSVFPTVYDFQNFTLNSGSSFTLVGPVVMTLANGMSINASMGSSANPTWLDLRFASGGLTLNTAVDVYGDVRAPNGSVIINAVSRLFGCIESDRLTVNANGRLTAR